MPDMMFGLMILACPVAMGVMMWIMMRGHKHRMSTRTGDGAERMGMRAEIDRQHSGRPLRG